MGAEMLDWMGGRVTMSLSTPREEGPVYVTSRLCSPGERSVILKYGSLLRMSVVYGPCVRGVTVNGVGVELSIE